MLALLSVSFLVIVHEAGHLVEMRRRNVPIEEFSLGMSFGLPSFVFHTDLIPEVAFKISPCLLGGYVKPTETGAKLIEAMPLKDQAVIYGAGVCVNSWVFVILGIGLQVHRKFHTRKFEIADAVVLFSAVLLWYKLWFCLFLIPVLGLLLLVQLIFKGGKGLKGVIGAVQEARTTISSPRKAVIYLALISLGIALLNMLPLYPLDGGRLMHVYLSYLSPSVAEVYRRGSAGVVVALIVLVTMNDILSLQKSLQEKQV